MPHDPKTLTEAAALAVPWVESPFFPMLLEQAEVDEKTKEMIRHFAEHGYVVFDPELPDSWVDGAWNEVKGTFASGNPNFYNDEKRVQDVWFFCDNVKKIANAPRVLEVLEILYRRKPFPFQTLNFRVGSEQRTHSDKAFFDAIPSGFMCGVWVALEDVDESNGPLHYYPGSQKLPTFNLHDLGMLASKTENPLHNVWRYEDFVQALIPTTGLARQELKIKKGQALIWSANLYHGGCPILDKARTRATQVSHYYFEGCLYYTPLASDPGLGRLTPRKIVYASDGSVVPQYYHGRLIANPGEWPPRLVDEVEEIIETPAPVNAVAEPQRRKFELLRKTFAALKG